jgi:hypothetical protein
MRHVASAVGLLIVAAILLFVYRSYLSQAQPSGVTTPRQTVDVVGVKSDLLAIGQAERLYQAQHGSYASLSDLASSGAMAITPSPRPGYTYNVQSSTDSFQVTAQCTPAAPPGCVNYAIDQTMEIHAVP